MKSHTSALHARLLGALGAAMMIPLTILPLTPALALETEPEAASEAAAPDPAPVDESPANPSDSPTIEPAALPLEPSEAPPVEPLTEPSDTVAPQEPTAAVAESPMTTSPAQDGPAAPDVPPAPLPAPAADTTGPQVTANRGTPPASGWYRGAQPVRFVADNPAVSMRSITVVIDGRTIEQAGRDVSVTVEGNGEHTLEYWGTDSDGRSGAAKSLSIAIDGVAPRFATGAPRVIRQGDEVSLGLECWDDHSGVQSCLAEGAADGALPSDELGDHTVALFARDHAGNEASELFSYRVEAQPVTQPELTFNAPPVPASGWYREPVGIIVSATTADPSDRITGVNWWSRGPISASGSAIDEDGIAFTIEADGVTQVTYTATTARGGLQRGEATVQIDGTRPDINFTGLGTAVGLAPEAMPTPYAWPTRMTVDTAVHSVELGSPVQLAFTCTDEHSGIEFCGEELPLSPSSSTSSSDRSISLDTSSLGPQSMVIETADIAGNRAKETFHYEVVAANTDDPGESPGEDPDEQPGEIPDQGSGKDPGSGAADQPTGKPGSNSGASPEHPAGSRWDRLAHTGSTEPPLTAVGVVLTILGVVFATTSGAIALTRNRAHADRLSRALRRAQN